MSLILNKKALLHAMVGASALLLVTGCSQKRHTFCDDDTLPCELPSPPSLAEPLVKPVATESKAIIAKASQSDLPTQEITKKSAVQVIETIRNQPDKKSNTATQVVFTKRAAQSDAVAGSYTIQLGAYKLESSRQTVMKRFKDQQPLKLFSMSNGYLGLSYGLYRSKTEAFDMAQALRHQGFNDLQIRKAP